MSAAGILIVEDEAVVRLHLKQIVERLGYRVIGPALSFETAMEAAASNPPELALVDINLSGDATGFDLAEALRDRHGTGIVFVTAFADEGSLEKSEGAGAVGYVVKPFSEPQLRAALATALAEHRRMKSLSESEQSLRRLVAGMGDAVIVVDEHGRIVRFNSLAAELTGTSAEKAVGSALRTVLIAEGNTLSEWFSDLEIPPVARRFHGLTIVSRDGSRSLVEGDLLPLQQASGAAGRVAVLLRADQSPVGPATPARLDESRRRDFHGMIGSSEEIRVAFEAMEQLAGVDWTVLIEGETGTGKELTARALHMLSARSAGPFVPVNCAALTDSLLSSQLFGHRRGAFTDAVNDHTGFFESASTGTLFLDEIGDVSPSMQKSILRVLDERTITRLGESVATAVDVRVVCATQRDLLEEVEHGRFRADLFFRLRASYLKLPPLRDRGEDVSVMASRFIAEAAVVTGKRVQGIESDALELLRTYRWPGNVRELKSAVDRAVLSCRGNQVAVQDLPQEIRENNPDPLPVSAVSEKERIVAALVQAGGNRSKAARLLGISRATLYRKMASLQIDEDGTVS